MFRKSRAILIVGIFSLLLFGACSEKSQPSPTEPLPPEIPNPRGPNDTLPPPAPNVPLPDDRVPGSDTSASKNLVPEISINYDGKPLDAASSTFTPDIVVGKQDSKFVMMVEDPDGDSLKPKVEILEVSPDFKNSDQLNESFVVQGDCNASNKCVYAFSPIDFAELGPHKITIGVWDNPSKEKLDSGARPGRGKITFRVNFISEKAIVNNAPTLEIYDGSGNRLGASASITVGRGQKAELMIKAKDSDGDPIDQQITSEAAQGCVIEQRSVTCPNASECNFLFLIDCGSRVGSYANTFTVFDKPSRQTSYKEAKAPVTVNVR